MTSQLGNQWSKIRPNALIRTTAGLGHDVFRGVRSFVDARPRTSGLMTWCLLTALFVYSRRGAILDASLLNPDEAELLVTGQRAGISFWPYTSFTTPTFGPTWAYFLAILNRFGLPMTLPVAHLLSAVFGASTVYLVHALLRRSFGSLRSLVVLAPLALIWAGGNLPREGADVVALSTLQLPIVLILSAYVVAGQLSPSSSPRDDVRLALIGGLLFLAFQAKYQIAVFCLIAVVQILLLVDRHRRRRAIVFLIVGAGGLATLLLSFVAIAGNLDLYINEAIGFLGDYIFHRQELTGSIPVPFLSRLGNTTEFIVRYPAFVYLFAVAYVYKRKRISDLAQHDWYQRCWDKYGVIIVLGATFVTLFVTSPLFSNYAHITLLGSVMALGATRKLEPTDNLSHGSSRLVVNFSGFAVASVFALVYLLPVQIQQENTRLGWSDIVSASRVRSPIIAEDGVDWIGTFCPPKSSVFVWGWASELYGKYEWEPASRYVVSTWHLMGTTRKAFYSRVLVSEIEERQPACIVEAIGPPFFGNFSHKDGIASSLLGVEKVLSDYVLHEGNFPGPFPMRIYVLRNSQ